VRQCTSLGTWLGLCWAAISFAAVGCEAAPPSCRFGREFALFRSEGQGFHELRTVNVVGGVVALYSDARGVHAQPLDPDGAPRAAARLLFEPCDGGFDAVGGREIELACLRRAGPEPEDDTGEVALYTLDPNLSIVATERFGRAGRLSKGIALAPVRASEPQAVLWHDAAVSGSRIWYFESGKNAAPRQLSDDAWEAAAPSLAWTGSRLYASWAETRYAGERAQSRLRIQAVSERGAAPHTVIESKDAAPSPRLVAVAGGLMLSFRDKRENGRKTGLYMARVADDGRLLSRVVRAGRADGRATPVLEPCLGGVVSATPRTFAGDYFVGVLRADPELRRLSPEQQFYEDSREFDRVAVQCGQDRALLLIAERGRLLKGNAALRSTTFRCE
jgi:hypothetical protein